MAAKSRSAGKSSAGKKGPKPGGAQRHAHSHGLLLIAAFKIFKGVFLLAIAFGARHLLSQNLAGDAEHLLDLLRIDPHNHYIHLLLERIAKIDERRLHQLRAGTFFYATLFLLEGTGLALRQRWAEYVTIISTSSLIPIEVYELLRHSSAVKLGLLFVNVVIVVYLIFELRRNRGA
ncbi:MAG TPA: DUF2127 domain-containing protein [Candidatus Acidoferrum sp.]|nr:DUF2127 domain-containing protein [Candidatus Acidoferrum sp.]